MSGSDGDRCRHRVMTKQAQTRLTLQSFHLPRRRKPSFEDETAIRGEADHRTLRELAAAFGVSHETIRMVLRRVQARVE
jgi:hypothetical protein